MELHEDAKNWLKTATKDIRFGPDRWAVEAELREHIEDKAADMARIFHIEGEEAEAEALKRMGDPVEIGKKLARLHKPWLGYLWNASQVLLGAVGLACVVCFFGMLYRVTNGPSAPGPALAGEYLEPLGLEPERAELGGYTFRVIEAKVSGDCVSVVLRASSPRFWEPVDLAATVCRTALVLDDGTRASVSDAWIAGGGSDGISPLGIRESEVIPGSRRPEGSASLSVYWTAKGFFYQDLRFELHGILCTPGERAALEIDFPIGQARLSALLREEAER